MKNVTILKKLSWLLIIGSVSALAFSSCTHTDQAPQEAPSEHPEHPTN